jgi:hypothetical protein
MFPQRTDNARQAHRVSCDITLRKANSAPSITSGANAADASGASAVRLK